MPHSKAALTVYPPHGRPRELGPLETFTLSAIAPSLAVVFTNPFDTAKVRLQLQGEQVYRNSFDCMWKIYRVEGIRGLQRGLAPAILRESSKNVFRLGMYDPIMAILHSDTSTSAPAWKRVVAGSICGTMGAVSCNPFELVKTRLQSRAPEGNAVGYQHNYRGVWHALTSIIKEDGVAGLYKGSVLSMGRSMLGSGSNLAAYSLSKEHLMVAHNWPDGVWLDMVSGMTSGIISCIAMNPVDVLRTRYYNQPWEHGKGVLYQSGLDAFRKVLANEGPRAFYKGFFTHFLRIGPHFCLTFVFLGILRRTLLQVYDHVDTKEAFAASDKDGDGKLDFGEVNGALAAVIPKASVPKLTDAKYNELLQSYSRRVLRIADQDLDGSISFTEFGIMVKEVRQILREHQMEECFRSFDSSSGDGKLDRKDLACALKEVLPKHPTMTNEAYDKLISSNVEKLLKYANADASGYVDYRSFESIVSKFDDLQQNAVVRRWGKVAGVKYIP